MSRSGYEYDLEGPALNLWRGAVEIMFINDDEPDETRWVEVRKWVLSQIKN